MIIGVSLYDLNEYRLTNVRANLVPLSQTVRDLRSSEVDWDLSRRVLSQYPQSYVRVLFPTVGESDAVLVGARGFVRSMFGVSSIDDQERALILPTGSVLNERHRWKRFDHPWT